MAIPKVVLSTQVPLELHQRIHKLKDDENISLPKLLEKLVVAYEKVNVDSH